VIIPHEPFRYFCNTPRRTPKDPHVRKTGLAGEEADLGLLEEAASSTLAWDAIWDQRIPQMMIGPWLAQLRGDQAAAAARLLRAHPEAARHFAQIAGNREADDRIRRAVRPASSAPSG
jgi:hypothetical protein